MFSGDVIMSNKELDSYLEALKIIAETTEDTEQIIKAIEKLQKKLE